MAVKGKGKEIASTPSSSKRPRKGSGAGASSSSAASKRRRSGVLRFVDDAAYVAEEDEEEDDLDSEEDLADFFDDIVSEGRAAVNTTKEKGKAVVDDPKPKEKSFIPFIVKEEELSGDELEEMLKQRYGRVSGVKYADYEDEYRDLPGPDPTKDPTIWRLKTVVGKERQVVFCFMQKYVDFDNRGNKLQTFSAFTVDHVKGFVYVEADKSSDVMEACRGFCNVYPTRITAVPTNEAPQLLAIRNKPSLLSKGTWVRLKNGNYKGDIARVVSVEDSKKKVMIKLVPRIDLRAISKKFGGAVSLKNAEIPPARLISPRELELFGPHIERKRDKETGEVFEVLDGNMLKDGYLFKRVALTSLIYWGVEPNESELNKFSVPDKEEDEEGIEMEGWVNNLCESRKKKKNLDTAGSSSADLKASSSKGLGDEDGADDEFAMHDLVFFGRKDFGVYLGAEKDGSYKILKWDTEGRSSTVVMVKRSEIKKVCSDKMFTAVDKNKKTICINDPVDVSSGPAEGKKGAVKHMYKGVMFIHNSEETENSGFFCAKSEHCENTKKPKEIPSENLDGNDNSASLFSPSSPSPFQSFDQQDDPRENIRRRQERESLFSIGQMLRIRRGPLKGYLCRVIRMFRNNVTVKLDSLVKIITVQAEDLTVPASRGQTGGSGAAAVATSNPFGDQGAQDGGSSWDTAVPSFTSDTWQPFGSSALPTTGATDGTAGGDGDPWGSKIPSSSTADPWNSDNANKPSDAWAKAADAGTSTQNDTEKKDDNPWGITEPVKSAQADDPWGNTEPVKSAQADDPWGNTQPVKSVQVDDPWGRTEPVKSAQVDDPWGSTQPIKKVQVDPQVDDPWGNTQPIKKAQVDDPVVSSDPWGQAVSKGPEVSDAWGKGKDVVSDELPAPPPASSVDAGGSWDIKGKGIASVSDDAWGNKQSDAWGQVKEKVKEGGDTGGWGGKPTGAPTQNTSDDAWGKVAKSQVTDTWGSKDNSDDAWGKAKEKSEAGGDTGGGGWGGGGNASWDKPNTSSWNKGGDEGGDNQGNSWNNSGGGGGGGGYEGRGRGRGGRGGWRGGRDGGDSGGSFRGRGRDGGESGGSFRGRGGGRFGGRGGRGRRGDGDDNNNNSDWRSGGNDGSSWRNDRGGGGDNTWGNKQGSWSNNNNNNTGGSWGNSQGEGEKKADWGSSSSWNKDESNKGGTNNDSWATKSEDKAKESDPWGTKATTGDGTNENAGAWGAKTGDKEKNAADPWGSKNTEMGTPQTGGWNTGGNSSQTQTDNWGKSGNDSDWSKPKFDLTGGDGGNANNNDESGWNRPRWNSDGGARGGGRGRGRGRNFGDRDGGGGDWQHGGDNNNGGRGNWRGGRGGGGGGDWQQGGDNNNGGRGNWRGGRGGGGRFGGGGRGGRGRDGDGGGNWNRDENKSTFGGGGGSWNSGGGGGGSSWNKDDNKSFGGGGTSSWSTDQGSSWGKSEATKNTGGGGWGEKKSSDWGSAGWGTEKNSSSGGGDKEKGNTSGGWDNSGVDKEKKTAAWGTEKNSSPGGDKEKVNTSGGWDNSGDDKEKKTAGWGTEKDSSSTGGGDKQKGNASGGAGGEDEKGKSAWGDDKPSGGAGGGGWEDKGENGGGGTSNTAGW